MAYVPGFDHDLFLSYAHNDSAEWIRALEERLRQQLGDILGDEVQIWQDTKNIRFGQDWPDEIEKAICRSVAFLAVLSPSYLNSDWCARERKVFLDHCKARNQLKAGSFHRFLKLVRLPWPGDAHRLFLQESQDISFFERTAAGVDTALEARSAKFRTRVAEAAHAIASLLQEMRGCRGSVFVASATDDCSKARAALRDELHGQGYDVRPDGVIDEGFADELIIKDIKPAVLSAHLIGGVYDPFVGRQIDLAKGLDKQLVFWLTQEARTTQDARQRELVRAIRRGKRQKDKWELLENKLQQIVIQDFLRMLRHQPATAVEPANGGPARVYLLCDPDTPKDADSAQQLQDDIRKVEGMQVELPIADVRGRKARHEELMRECHGVLLYRKAAPERWLYQFLPDVVYAERLFQRPPVISKACLLNDASLLQGFSGVPLFLEPPKLSLKVLEPFLTPLRGRSAHVIS